MDLRAQYHWLEEQKDLILDRLETDSQDLLSVERQLAQIRGRAAMEGIDHLEVSSANGPGR